MTVLIFCVGSSQPSVTLPHCSKPPSSSAEVTPGPFLVETQILLLRKRLALGICFKCHLKVSPVVGFFLHPKFSVGFQSFKFAHPWL